MINPTANAVNLPNIGIVIDKLNPFLFQRIKKEISLIKQDIDKNYTEKPKDVLSAFHKKMSGYYYEKSLSDSLIKDIDNEVLKLIELHESKFQCLINLFNFVVDVQEIQTSLNLERMWVNVQRRTEFLPLHTHSGLYSFVIWVDVPFSLNSEKTQSPNDDLIKDKSGLFTFVYNDILGKVSIFEMPVDNSWEGKICIFPAGLQHMVYPFYSTEEVRISIAGNYRLKVIDETEN